MIHINTKLQIFSLCKTHEQILNIYIFSKWTHAQIVCTYLSIHCLILLEFHYFAEFCKWPELYCLYITVLFFFFFVNAVFTPNIIRVNGSFWIINLYDVHAGIHVSLKPISPWAHKYLLMFYSVWATQFSILYLIVCLSFSWKLSCCLYFLYSLLLLRVSSYPIWVWQKGLLPLTSSPIWLICWNSYKSRNYVLMHVCDTCQPLIFTTIT